ncbi:hypothetical protein O181_110807 [Austropuccinia psidii MF-1]|uniref:Uncharacterized protein n=1 Tax=Austropuccinia psidii MF-1 TaxID=1389203 RepID=A0A9Q3JYS8_9BASI|nr:hypothetical protein [Austropuccinia psidii MF-1]
MLEKGWNLKLPIDTLKKHLVDVHTTASSFKLFLDKVRHHAKQSPKKFEDSFEGTFIIQSLHAINAVQVELSGELKNKHPTFPVSLVKHYTSSDKELFPLRNETPLEVPQFDQCEEKKVLKVLKERRFRGKDERENFVRYKHPQHEYE